jgi:DNA-binding response OmpR family regulator
MRREQAEAPRSRITVGKLMLDLDTRQASCGEASARLTPREADLLGMLMESIGKPVSRAEIFDRLWASQGGLSLNVVDVYIGYLRSKMADFVRYGGPGLVTVRGKGFMLELRGPDFRQ